MKFLFLPFSILGGIVAGLIAKKTFEAMWGLVDDQEPPDTEHREVHYGKLTAALVLEGATSASSASSSTTAHGTALAPDRHLARRGGSRARIEGDAG